jgi:nitrate reductase assembly molybdenum cofactor insertion protein NarJ
MTTGLPKPLPGDGAPASTARRVADLPTAEALRTIDRLLAYPDDATRPLFRFAETERLAGLDGAAREELYVATFDVNPRCVPYVSIHLFGEENFKRGEFMAALRARYAEAGFDAAGELPDHVGTLLRFAADLDGEERAALCRHVLLGPLGRMIDALDAEHPYRPLLEAAREALHAAHPGVIAEPAWFERRPAHFAPGAADRAAFASGSSGGGPAAALGFDAGAVGGIPAGAAAAAACGSCALASAPNPEAVFGPDAK